MGKISLYLTSLDVTVTPDNYNHIRVEIDGVELSEVIEEIADNPSILNTIGTDEICEWINGENKTTEILDEMDTQSVAEYLERRGWKIQWGS